MLYHLARPLLFSLDPEVAHALTLAQLERAHALKLVRCVAPAVPDLPVTVMGLRFRNPVGLAAGMDKNAAHIDALGDLGFGFIEAGTVTPLAQSGNPKPRMFRLVPARGLINRLGFNNLGVQQYIANVTAQKTFRAHGGIIGLNIGKNAATPIEDALSDYLACLRAVYAHADYVTVNISSPNTKSLRALQGERELGGLLTGLADERQRLQKAHGRRVPLVVKIAPDLAAEAIAPLADILVQHGIDAVIATNTTLDRTSVSGMPRADEAGGLSGAPLRERSTETIRRLSAHLQGALPIIGVGGILSGADAVEKIEAGASLVQIYTGLIYRGPTLVAECVDALRKRMNQDAPRTARDRRSR
ncbi:MAG: quinone-dependent dihydroorotate dehydrogenase [Burkholderiaceae bacterium]